MTSSRHPVPGRSTSLHATVKRIAAAIVVAALLAWVLHRAWLDARAIDWDALQMRPGLIVLSVPVMLVAWFWHGVLWGFMLRGLGYRMGTLTAVRASLVGNLGNYIPGKVFIVIIRGKLVARQGVPMVVVASSVVLETLLRNMMGAVVAGMGLWHLGVGRSYAGGLVLLLAISIIVVHPAIFNRLTDFALRKLNRPPLPRRISLGNLVALLGGFLIYWCIYSVAFFLLASGTLGADWAQLPALSVALVISLIASMLAFFTPVGLGVADATMAGVLSLTGAVAGAGVLAVIMRVWRTLTEVGIAGIGWVLPVGPPVDLSDAEGQEEQNTTGGADR